MNNLITWIYILFACFTILLFYILQLVLFDVFFFLRIEDKILLGSIFRISSLISFLISVCFLFYILFFNKKIKRFLGESILELNKVAWPTLQETSILTIMVVTVAVIISIILGVFDALFSWLNANDFFAV